MDHDAHGPGDHYEHLLEPGGGGGTLLLLHGTGGTERSLVGLGRLLAPSATLLSLRGQVDEGGMLRFFRRHRPGVLDVDDLLARCDAMAAFVERTVAEHDLPRPLAAVGFSNGANMAAALLLRHGRLLDGAALLAPMGLPIEPDPRRPADGVPALVVAGRADTIVPPDLAEGLVAQLRDAGAQVDERWHDGGHTIDRELAGEVGRWLRRSLPGLDR